MKHAVVMPPAPEDNAGSAAAAPAAAETSPTADAMAKYHAAADAANRALTAVVAGCVPGAVVLDLCRLGDATIIEFTKPAFAKSKDILKELAASETASGIAFPTCVSSGSAICHVSPIEQDASSIPPLADGDCVRVELAAHVDGYIAHAAHTLVIGASTESPATGRKADVLAAGHACLDVALRLLRPGKTNWEVTDVIEKTASEFGCKPVQGMMAHQLDQNVLEGKKRIVMNPTTQHRKETETETIEAGDVFSLDILVSTGDGIPRNVETHRTTIFRKLPDASYALKTASARGVFATVKKDFGDM
ncbi:Proliferation-associated protein 2G4, partial [Cladochytrium tenue]